VTGAVAHFEQQGWLHPVAAISQRAIGRGQVEQAHFAAAQRQRQIEAAGVGQRAHAQPGQQADQGVHADVIQGDDGGDVIGGSQRLADEHRAVLHQPEVGRGVALQAAGDERCADVENHCRRRPGIGPLRVEGRRVGERLERRPRLARGQRRVDRAINALVEVVGAAEEGQHLAGVRIEGDQRGVLRVVRRLAGGRIIQPAQMTLRCIFGGALPGQVECGDHVQPARQQFIGELALKLRPHGHDEMRCFDGEGGGGVLQLLGIGPIGFGLREIAMPHHQVEHNALAGLCPCRVGQRIVLGGRLRQSGQHRTFGQRQLVGSLAKVGAGRRADAIGQVAIVGLVEVERQDFIARVALRQFEGQHAFAQLAAQRALGALLRIEQQVARHLLGDRAAPGDDFSAAHVDPQGAGDALDIYPRMLVEVGVFGRQRRLNHARRQVGQRDHLVDAGLRVGNLVEQVAPPVVDTCAGQGHAAFDGPHVRQAGEHPGVGRGQRAEEDRAQEGRHLHPATAAFPDFPETREESHGEGSLTQSLRPHCTPARGVEG